MSAPEVLHAGVDFNSLALVGIGRKAIGGQTVKMRPYEKCITLRIEDESVSFVFETYMVRETATRTTFTKSGRRIVSYSRVTWNKTGEMIVWDDEVKTPAIANLGRVTTPEEAAERREHERMTYRPGNARFPLDNFERVQAGRTTDAMERYF